MTQLPPPPGTATAAATGPLQVEDLGVVRVECKLNTSSVAAWRDGRPALYVQGGSPGDGVSFGVVDARTGQSLASHKVPGLGDSLSMVTGPDGRAYIPGWGPDARLVRYDPASDDFTDLGIAVAGESHICRLQVMPDGVIWGGTFPHGHVFSWDPVSEEFTDLGQLGDGEWYARSIAHDGEHTLYVGTEGRARVLRWDLRTGGRGELPSPPDVEPLDYRVSLLACRGGLLFAYHGSSGDWHVYDPAADAWIDRIPGNAHEGRTTNPPSMPTEVDPATNSFHLATAGSLHAYDLGTRTWTPTGFDHHLDYVTGGGGINLVDLADPAWPGLTVIGVGREGGIWKYNPQLARGEVVTEAELPTTALTVRSLGIGPDDKVYVGYGFNSGVLTRWNPRTGALEHQRPFSTGQVHSQLVARDGTMWFGTYSDGVLVRYRPSEPYEWGTNPAAVHSFGDRMQDRLFGLVELADGRIVVGGLGKRGHPDGILAVHDPRTGGTTTHEAVLPGHAIIALTTVDGVVYGGTSVVVPGADPVAETAVIFAWDPDSEELLWEATLPGVTTVSKLRARADGRLWALTTAGTVVLFDRVERVVVRTVEVGEPGGNYGFATLGPADDGFWYGSTASGDMFRLEPTDGDVQRLGQGHYLVAGPEGTFHFAGMTTLHRAAR